MKDWRIHFGWAIATLLAAGVSARLTSRRAMPEQAPGAHVPDSHPAQSSSSVIPVSKTDPLPEVTANAALRAAPLLGELSIEDRIRSLIKMSDNWNDFQEARKDLTDREMKLRLARESFAGKNNTSVAFFMMVLREIKGRDVAEILESYLKTHPDYEYASAAAGALGAVGDPGSLGPLNEALHSQSEEVRDASARALLLLGYGAPMDEMMSTLMRQYENADGGIRREAIERITNLNPSAAVPLLARALRDSNSDVRMAAVQAFSSLGGAQYAPLLEPLLNDPSPRVATQARDFVEALKDPGK